MKDLIIIKKRASFRNYTHTGTKMSSRHGLVAQKDEININIVLFYSPQIYSFLSLRSRRKEGRGTREKSGGLGDRDEGSPLSTFICRFMRRCFILDQDISGRLKTFCRDENFINRIKRYN